MTSFTFRSVSRRRAPAVAAALASLAALAPSTAGAAGSCKAQSEQKATAVVELYTSEGCSSCPPADRWLSGFKSDPNVIALAFHVDYWDRLGWKDRFASPAFTARQANEQQSNGARFSYTPQVVVDGADTTDWSSIADVHAARTAKSSTAPKPPAVELALARDGDQVSATVTALPGAPRRLAAYWAVTEQAHATAVRAGENQGATLHHDFVVREYRPVTAWTARSGSAETLHFATSVVADPAHPRQINLVILDAESGRPVQALKIAC